MKKILFILICLFVSFEVNSKLKFSDMKFEPIFNNPERELLMDKRHTIPLSNNEYIVYTLVNLKNNNDDFGSYFRQMLIDCKKKKYKFFQTLKFKKEWGGGGIVEEINHSKNLVNLFKNPKKNDEENLFILHTCVDYEKEKKGTLEKWFQTSSKKDQDSFVDTNNVLQDRENLIFSFLININDSKNHKLFKSMVTRHNGNCKKKEFKISGITIYDEFDGKGNFVGYFESDATLGKKGNTDEVFEILCVSCDVIGEYINQNSEKKIDKFKCDRNILVKSLVDNLEYYRNKKKTTLDDVFK